MGNQTFPVFLETVEQRVEVELPAQGLDLRADILHHLGEVVGADVGILLVGHLLGCPVFVELVEDVLVVFAIDVGVEFAVGEGAGPALAELDVGFGVQHFGLEEALHRLLPLLDTLSALDDDGSCAAAGEIECGEHACGSETDHHGREVVRPLRVGELRRRGRLPHPGRSEQGTVLVGQRHLHLEVVLHAVLLPRIHRLPHNPKAVQILRPDLELLANEVLNIPRGFHRHADIRKFESHHI